MGQGTGRVTRAVIANAPHPVLFPKLLWINPHQRKSSQYMREFRDTANDALVREHGLGGILLKAFGDRLVGGDDPMEPAERAALSEDWQNREAAFGMLNWYRASPMAVPPMDVPFELPAGYAVPPMPPLKIPTLVIWALDDLALPPENLDGMELVVTDLTLVKVPGCGHFVPWEAPDAVNAALDAFLGKTADAG
jgi:pimeloyl-ACP methyl ester carboxylesterase